MQSLFALQQCKEANYELCLDKINETFLPDLNSMQVQDKALLNTQKKNAAKLFEKSFAKGDTAVEHEDPKVQKVVNDCFHFYYTQSKKDSSFFLKNLISEVERIYDHYIAVLMLPPVFSEIAEADKKVSHKNFISNAWIKALRQSEELKKNALKLGRHWNDKQDKIKGWFRDVVRQDNEYLHYLDKKNITTDDQKKFVHHLFKKVILGKTIINEYFEEEVLRWAEDKEIVKGMVEKSLKSYDPETPNSTVTLYTLSVNWDEDKEFIEKLYNYTIDLDREYKDLIAANTRNWEVERLPLTDRTILEMAMTELLVFPNIPVKVTINEYIELAKNYSTPNSRQFVNGILDVLSKELKDKGNLRKSGRGLIDNK
jgi:transcription antitermination protein NusB